MQTTFFAPEQLRPKDVGKWNIEFTYNFRFEPQYIEVEYEYRLTDEEVYALLKEFFKQSGLADYADVDTLLSVMCALFDCTYEDINDHLSDYLEYKPLGIKLRDWMKDQCKKKAFKEFQIAFNYWVDSDEMIEYVDTDEV